MQKLFLFNKMERRCIRVKIPYTCTKRATVFKRHANYACYLRNRTCIHKNKGVGIKKMKADVKLKLFQARLE